MNILCSFLSSFTKYSWIKNNKLRNNDLLCLSESTCKPQITSSKASVYCCFKTKSMTVLRAFFSAFPLF